MHPCRSGEKFRILGCTARGDLLPLGAMTSNCFYLRDGQPVGPHPIPEVIRLQAAGQIAPDSMIWEEGTPDWVPLADWLARRVPPPPAPPSEALISGLRLVAGPKNLEGEPILSGTPKAAAEPEPKLALVPSARVALAPASEPIAEPVRVATSAAPADKPLLPDAVISASVTIPPRPLSMPYRVGLALCGLLTLLVPIIYLSVAGSVGWWGAKRIYHYPAWAKQNLAGISSGRMNAIISVFYLLPAVAAGAVGVFMGSMLFARRSERERPIVLGRAAQPRLYSVIERLCHVVGAPMPERIEIECTPNAAASLGDGIRGVWDGGLRLTIGLPLVSALSVREFTGVLAHEFGHFAQRGGMRLSVAVRRLNARLAELAWSRTEWDDRLSDALGSGVGVAVAGALAVKLGVGIARLFLKGLVMLNHAAVCALLRQMEFDADRAEAHIAGSAAFASTFRRITVISSLFERYHLRGPTIPAHPTDLPSYLMDEFDRLRPDEEQRMSDEEETESESWWSTHPPTKARVAAATALAAPGVILSDAPASALFDHYDDLARIVTKAHFEVYEPLWALERRAMESM